MAIWSLTEERIEKLKKQISDKEVEVDALQKLTPKDIWTQDLDAFVEEWNTQLEDEDKRAKKTANLRRRASGRGVKGGKRKKKRADDDSDSDEFSDYGPAKKKAKPKTGGLLSYLKADPDEPAKSSATVVSKTGASKSTKQTGMLSYLKKETPDAADPTGSTNESAPAVTSKRGRPAGSKAIKKPVLDPIGSDSDSDIYMAVAKEASKKTVTEPATKTLTSRGAAKKIPSYQIDESDSDIDLTELIKASNGTSRTGSAAPAPSKTKSQPEVRKASPVVELDDEDETNHDGLASKTLQDKPAASAMDDESLLASDDEDDFGFGLNKKVAPKPAAKPAPKPKTVAKFKPSAPSALVAKKTTQLSPAAKAYAARLGKTKDLSGSSKIASKAKKPVMDDSDDNTMMDDANKLADEILSDDEDEQPVAKKPSTARPGRRVAAKPAKYVVSDDEDEDEPSEASFDDESE